MITEKKILIPGGTGFLGRALERYFLGMGFLVRILTRHPKADNERYWDGKSRGDWEKEIDWADVVINLAGKSVDCRYNAKNKAEIMASRLKSTAILAVVIKDTKNPPETWLNASSATTYVHSEKQQMTEDEGIIGDDFSMNVCKEWEAEFFKHDLICTRRVALRASIVMGNEGGALPKLKQITRLFLGGKQGSGSQFVSWIHILDFCRAVDFIIHNSGLIGPVNLAAPNPIRNEELMFLLRKKLNRFFGIGQSKWFLELGAKLVGTETELLLKSRNVVPERLIEKGFEFEYVKMGEALENLIK